MRENNTVKGIFHIILAAFFFSLMSVFVRMSGDLPTMQKAFFRNAIAVVIAFYMLKKSNTKIAFSKENVPALVLRSVFGTMGILCNFWALDHLGIADANMLNKMSPFFAMVMSIWILKEKPTLFEVGCIVAAFIGVAFVVKPSSGLASYPALIGLLGGLAAGTAYTYVRKLGKNGVPGPLIVLFFSVFSTLITMPSMFIGYQPMSLKQWIILLLAGASATGGQMNITAAYTYAPAAKISVYDYTQILFAALFGIFIFHEMPDLYSVIGYVIIISVAIIKYIRQ